MRSFILRWIPPCIVGTILFLVVSFVIPEAKPHLDQVFGAASGVSLCVAAVRRAPILVRCPCGAVCRTIYAKSGTATIACDGFGRKHRVFVPLVPVHAVAKQNVQRILGRDDDDIAFSGTMVAA